MKPKKRVINLTLNPERPTHKRVIEILKAEKEDMGMSDFIVATILSFDDSRNHKA